MLCGCSRRGPRPNGLVVARDVVGRCHGWRCNGQAKFRSRECTKCCFRQTNDRLHQQMPHRVAHIYAPDALPDRLLLVGPGGRLTVTDLELNIQASSSEDQDECTLLQHHVFPQKATSFMSNQTTLRDGVVAVSILRYESDLRVVISTIDSDGRLHSLGSCSVALDDHVRRHQLLRIR